MFAAMLWSDPVIAFMSLVGSVTGMCFAFGFGAAQATIAIGLYGYNPVIGCIAIFGVFFKKSFSSFVLAVICSLLCTLIQACLFTIFAPIGMPTLTFPFCISAILCVGIGRSMTSRLEALGLPDE